MILIVRRENKTGVEPGHAVGDDMRRLCGNQRVTGERLLDLPAQLSAANRDALRGIDPGRDDVVMQIVPEMPDHTPKVIDRANLTESEKAVTENDIHRAHLDGSITPAQIQFRYLSLTSSPAANRTIASSGSVRCTSSTSTRL